MTTMFTAAFDAVKAALGGAADCTITRGRDVITDAMSDGVTLTRQQDDNGRWIDLLATVRFKASDNPTGDPIAEGDPVTITIGTDDIDGRVFGMKVDASGVVRFAIQEPND